MLLSLWLFVKAEPRGKKRNNLLSAAEEATQILSLLEAFDVRLQHPRSGLYQIASC